MITSETYSKSQIYSDSFENDSEKYKMIAENVTISYGGVPAVKDVSMKFKEKSVTALIGPSGCGKTTFLRCLNRMHDMTKNAKVEGKVMIDGIDLYSKEIDPIYHRRKLAWCFKNQILFQLCPFLIMLQLDFD